MPRLSVWSIRLALIYFIIGITIGALLLINKAVNINQALWYLLRLHSEILMMPWTTLLIFGVTFWILPRFTGNQRGNERLAWGAFYSFNFGIVLTIVGLMTPNRHLILSGRALEFIAVLLYSFYIWARIRPTYPS